MIPFRLSPDSLVMLVGASGSGKTTWARRWFTETQVVSSDRCRALVSDDEGNQAVNREAFAVFSAVLRQRTSLGRLTVADSTGLEDFSRRRMAVIAAESDRPVHVVVFFTPLEVVLENNARRSDTAP